MLDHGNEQLSSVGAFLPALGGAESSPAFFGGGVGGSIDSHSGFDLVIGKDNQPGKVVNCAIVFGRQLVKCGDVTLTGVLGEDDEPRGVIYAKISHAAGEALALTVEHGSELPGNTLEYTYRLLYEARGESPNTYWVDFRYVPVIFSLG